jgi:hypothetical protein
VSQTKGAEPEALVNFAALLGARWHDAPSDGKKAVDTMSMDELIEKVRPRPLSNSYFVAQNTAFRFVSPVFD